MATRVVVTGSKSVSDYSKVKVKLDQLLEGLENIVILSGSDEGADLLGQKYGVERDHDIIVLPINWSEYGKQAANIRNQKMFNNCQLCLILWDGKSSDTGYRVVAAKKYNVPYKVARI